MKVLEMGNERRLGPIPTIPILQQPLKSHIYLPTDGNTGLIKNTVGSQAKVYVYTLYT